MGINDIADQQARAGELDPAIARDIGYSPRRNQQQSGSQSSTRAMTDGGAPRATIQVPENTEFWLEVAKVALLFLIALKL